MASYDSFESHGPIFQCVLNICSLIMGKKIVKIASNCLLCQQWLVRQD
jgi:hypothetical protein